MTPTPHSQRCETCGHYKEGKHADTCKNIPFPDHMDSAERQYIKDWIIEHGCASHTSAVTLTPALAEHYATLSVEKGKPVSELVAQNLGEYQEYRRWLVNEAERL